jgi:aldose 1-epimerase
MQRQKRYDEEVILMKLGSSNGLARLADFDEQSSSQTLSLAVNDSVCVVAPAAGGSIISWTVDGQNLLRAPDVSVPNSGDPLTFASFPLVPFSNRIAFGQFEWEGERIQIEANFAPEPHAIHGIGWRQPWYVADQSQTSCTLAFFHKANEKWPWSFSATQLLTVTPDSLTLELAATNLEDKPVPLAFGHHPYFDSEGATLQFHARSVLVSDSQSLPTSATAPFGDYDFTSAARVAGRDVDSCYADWDGHCEIVWVGRTLKLQVKSDMKAAVVYIPRNNATFCFEPVPHINNALNRKDGPGLLAVAPGDTWRSFIQMRALRA